MEPPKRNLPEWARSIVKLRKRLGLSQAGLGGRLQYSPMAVSRWERGVKEPPAQCWIRLGNLAGDPDCWAFWARAGLRRADIARAHRESRSLEKTNIPELQVVLAGSGRKRQPPPKMELAAIPVLPIRAATRGETGDQHGDLDQVAAESIIAVPLMWFPNPEETSCLRVKGSSMSPIINDGDIIAVDSSQNDSSKLGGKIVVATHPEHGLSVGRLLLVDGIQVLESENRDYAPVLLSRDRNWRIVGRVLWWLRQAP